MTRHWCSTCRCEREIVTQGATAACSACQSGRIHPVPTGHARAGRVLLLRQTISEASAELKYLLVPALVALVAFVLAGPARADVHLQVSADDPVSEVSEPNGWTITPDAPVDAIRFLLPSHGKPCGRSDQPGKPRVGDDPDSNFVVTGSEPAGALVTGRWVTIPGPITAGQAVHVSVLAGPLGGCFYPGATADAAEPVVGLAKGASVQLDQDTTGLAVSGSVQADSDSARLITVTWLATNNGPATELWSERLGASDGFELVSSDWETIAKPARRGVSWSWRDQTIIDHGETLVRHVVLRRSCGLYSVNLRLRDETTDGRKYGTGDGLNVRLARGC